MLSGKTDFDVLRKGIQRGTSSTMKITDIAIHADTVGTPHQVLREITAKVSKGSVFSKSPTIEDVNFKLQEEASRLGANAVIKVAYSRGMSLMSYEVLKAVGTAVIVESDEVQCRFCAETIKRAATKCKHCGSDLTV
jgi:Putative heavy-metal-binding